MSLICRCIYLCKLDHMFIIYIMCWQAEVCIDTNMSNWWMLPWSDNKVSVDCLCKTHTWLISLCPNNNKVSGFLITCPNLIVVKDSWLCFCFQSSCLSFWLLPLCITSPDWLVLVCFGCCLDFCDVSTPLFPYCLWLRLLAAVLDISFLR